MFYQNIKDDRISKQSQSLKKLKRKYIQEIPRCDHVGQSRGREITCGIISKLNHLFYIYNIELSVIKNKLFKC